MAQRRYQVTGGAATKGDQQGHVGSQDHEAWALTKNPSVDQEEKKIFIQAKLRIITL